MLRLIWSPRARINLRDILEYIAERNPSAADRLQELIEGSAERLPLFPLVHRSGRILGTREAVVHPNYIVVYRVEAEASRVVSVLHARQQYP